MYLLVLTFLLEGVTCYTGKSREHVENYANRWTVQISGGLEVATTVAEELGFSAVEDIPVLPDLYRFLHFRHPRKAKYENKMLTEKLKKHEKVSWAAQVAMERREIKNVKCPGDPSLQGVSKYENAFDDELFGDMWYVQDCRKSPDEVLRDINVVPVYYKHNLFGKGVKVVIVDDGVETTHEDLKDNYDKRYGLDLIDGDDTPDPRHYLIQNFAHGTKCAGVVAMRAGNHLCGTGIAPLVTLGAVRLIGINAGTDENDAKALSFKVQEIDIMSNSWGPTDDGKTMTRLGPLTKAALKEGIIQGRGGKGIIYVFPAGNGKGFSDTCGYDMFANTMYTITVAGVDHTGKANQYSERCAGVMVTTYSGDLKTSYNIATTYVGKNKCTENHNGTSAATPIVAGALALVLEANPNLTWREVQHAIAWCSEKAPLDKNIGWHPNKAGFYRSNNFGFGLLNVNKMVEFVQTMKPIPPMSSCVVPIDLGDDKRIVSRLQGLEITVPDIDGCKTRPTEVNYLEHVQLIVDMDYPKRGAIKINIRSPLGTLSHLLESREKDSYTGGLKDWTLDTIHFWGESPMGTWVIYIFDRTGKSFYAGEVKALSLIFHGTKDIPPHYTKPRTYQDGSTLNEVKKN